MSRIRISKSFHFEAAHALKGYEGACRHIHGHSYELIVTLLGVPDPDTNASTNGMVMDFSELKRIIGKNVVDPLDHALLLPENYPEMIDTRSEAFSKMVVLPYQPTSENLLIDMAEKIKPLLPQKISLHSLKLRETGTCFAEWYASDNEESY